MTSRNAVVLAAFLGIIGFFLFTEHRAHLFGVLPFLFLLACPFLHFMHGGHGHDHDGSNGRPTGTENPQHHVPSPAAPPEER